MVKDALESEIKGKFIGNRAWDVVPRPTDRKVVKSKWVLRYYVKEDGSVKNEPGGSAGMAGVPDDLKDAVVEASEECPGECIFIEEA